MSNGAGLGSLRVLIVDDYPDIAHLVGLLIQRLGCQVRTSSGGQECLDCAATFRPNVVLLDLVMPHIDGYEVARRLQMQPGNERPTLIAMTGFRHEVDTPRANGSVFALHLLKPIQFEELQGILEQCAAMGLAESDGAGESK